MELSYDIHKLSISQKITNTMVLILRVVADNMSTILYSLLSVKAS